MNVPNETDALLERLLWLGRNSEQPAQLPRAIAEDESEEGEALKPDFK